MKKLIKLIKIRHYAKAIKRGVDDPEVVLSEISKALAVGYLLWWGLMALGTLAVFYLLGFTSVFEFGPLEFFEVLFYISAALLVIVSGWIIFIWLQLRKLARHLHERIERWGARDARHTDVEVIDGENQDNQ